MPMTIEQAKRNTEMVRRLRAGNKHLQIALRAVGMANLTCFGQRDVQSIVQNALYPQRPFENFLRKVSRG